MIRVYVRYKIRGLEPMQFATGPYGHDADKHLSDISSYENVYDVHLQLADLCYVCGRSRGSIKGNERVVMGRIICDYCDTDWVLTIR